MGERRSVNDSRTATGSWTHLENRYRVGLMLAIMVILPVHSVGLG